MGLKEEVRAATKRSRIPKWDQVCTALGKDWDEFLECLDDPAVPTLALQRVIKARGVPISDATINAWRRDR